MRIANRGQLIEAKIAENDQEVQNRFKETTIMAVNGILIITVVVGTPIDALQIVDERHHAGDPAPRIQDGVAALQEGTIRTDEAHVDDLAAAIPEPDLDHGVDRTADAVGPLTDIGSRKR